MRMQREPNDEQLLIEGGDEEVEVEEDEFVNDDEVGNIEGDGPDDLDPPVQEAQRQGGAVLQVVGRRVRGAEDEQGDVASRLEPTIPGPCEGEPLVDADGWREIDRLSAWECEMNIFTSMEEVPSSFRVGGGRQRPESSQSSSTPQFKRSWTEP